MKKKLRRWLALLLVKILIFVSSVVPRRVGLALFSTLGGLAFRLYRRERERAIENVSRAFPGTAPLIVRAMVKSTFASLGRNAFDALRLTSLPSEMIIDLCSVEGEEHLRIPYERGGGVIALTGHIGCWELLAAYFSNRGYKVSVIARDLHDKRLNDILVRMRERHGITSIPRGSSAVAGYRVLRKGEILGMLIDQDIDVDGIFVPFFGIPAYTPRGAAAFALRSGASIVPMAIQMQPGGGHRIIVLPQLEWPSDVLPEEERIDELTVRCSEAVEKLIRFYPQQWVWFHDRWRRKPKDIGSDKGNEPAHAGGAELREDRRSG